MTDPKVPGSFHQRFMDLRGLDGIIACGCRLWHRLLIRDLIVADDALARSATLLAERYGTPVVYVLSDENTEEAAGARWKSGIRARHLHSRVLPALPKPVPSQELVDVLVSEVRDVAPDLVVSIGSGVLSDLGKKIALDAGVPNWCVATAASVDAYASMTAAIRIDGHHRVIPGRVSEVVVCDLSVIAGAPRVLLLAGLGDMLAKFLAHLDWNVARRVAGDAYCSALAAFALGAARQSLESASRVDRDLPAAVRMLVDAAMVSGLTMQAFGSSRPAASAEHTIAHFWDAVGAVTRESMALHGLEVGAAVRLVLPGYQAFYEQLATVHVDHESRLAALEDEAEREQPRDERMRVIEAQIARERRGRICDRTVLARRLAAFERERLGLAAVATSLLEEVEGAIRVLDRLGFPFSPQVLGIASEHSALGAKYVRCLRNRYTTFDLAYEIGREDTLLGPITAGSMRSEQ